MERRDRQYIGDLSQRNPREYFTLAIGLFALSAILGFLIGFVVWGLLWVSGAITSLLWYALPDYLGNPGWLTFVICSIGGLVIGIWTKLFNNPPDHLETVLSDVKNSGGYRLKGNPFTSVVSFLLPLAFGGSVGPEAGLTGIIAAGCTWIGSMLNRAGVRAQSVADITTAATLSAVFSTPFAGFAVTALDASTDSSNVNSDEVRDISPTYRKGVKVVLYAISALGAFGGIVLVKSLAGGGMDLPRFAASSITLADIAWIAPCLIVAYAMSLMFHACNRILASAAKLLSNYPITRALIVGLTLGIIGTAFPLVLFSGEEQSVMVMSNWAEYAGFTLLAIAALKAFATLLCLTFGWNGGQFFPVIFCGVVLGYAMASFSGADPMLMVMVTTAAVLGGITRKPALSACMLLLCFPLSGIIWGVAAAVIGAKMPLPRCLKDARN